MEECPGEVLREKKTVREDALTVLPYPFGKKRVPYHLVEKKFNKTLKVILREYFQR